MKSNLSRLSVFQAEELLEGNIDIFTTFISLIADSTRQLKQFQAANGSLTNKLEDLYEIIFIVQLVVLLGLSIISFILAQLEG